MITDKVYIVTRLYISASDYSTNGHSDCEVFLHQEDARKLFGIWRDEELGERKEIGYDYEILTDDEDKFHCSWDSYLEMMVLTVAEKNVRS